MRLCCTILGLLFITSAAQAVIVDVPGDFQTIQGAIDSCRDRDTIVVAPGEYSENINLNGRAIVVGSRFILSREADDIVNTIITAAEEGSVVKIASREQAVTVLEGFSLTGGTGEQNGGGGIYIFNSSPTLRNLRIYGNTAVRGGGILCWTSDARISDVEIFDNEAEGHGGGICYMEQSNVILDRASIHDNHATQTGGGLSSFSGRVPQITDCEFIGNTCDRVGGGVAMQGVGDLEDVLIAANEAGTDGGGIYISGDPGLARVIISGNAAGRDGGGVAVDGSGPSFNGVQITGNQCEQFGGGIYVLGDADRPTVNMRHVTLSRNAAGEGGNGVYAWDQAVISLRNSILWEHEGGAVVFAGEGEANRITVTYNDFEGGEDGIEANDNAEVTWGDGNIDADPLFVNPDEEDFNLSWENYPEEDESRSPCIDAGDPNSPLDPDGTTTDLGAWFYYQPAPDIFIAENIFDFGTVNIGDSAAMTVVINNIGDGLLRIREQVVAQDGEYWHIQSGGGEVAIAAQDSHETEVLFKPTMKGRFDGQLRIVSNDRETPEYNLFLVARGANRAPVLTQPIPDFHGHENSGTVQIVDLDTCYIDPDGDDIFYEVAQGNHLLRLELRLGGHLSMSPAPGFNSPDGEEVFILADDRDGGVDTASFIIYVEPLGVDPDESGLPEAFALHAPYPNPFNSRTVLSFDLPQRARVALKVLDARGRRVGLLLNETRDPGRYRAVWDANVPAGMYWVVMEADGFRAERSVVLVN